MRISDETRQRVVDAARSLNYLPYSAARSLLYPPTRILGLVLLHRNSSHVTANTFLRPVVEGIASVINPTGFKLMVELSEDSAAPTAFQKLTQELRVDGVIFAAARLDDLDLLQTQVRDFPAVLWGTLPGSHLPAVDVDNVAAARTAVEHLIGLGHERIACVTYGPLEDIGSAERLSGYRLALESRGLPFDETLVRYGDCEESSGFEAMLSLLALPNRPSAVFVASDDVALSALQAAKSVGVRIPQDVALVGFDDIPAAKHVAPPLTTVVVPARELGIAAARMLMEIIQTGHRPGSKILDTHLVVRESCGIHARSTAGPQFA